MHIKPVVVQGPWTSYRADLLSYSRHVIRAFTRIAVAGESSPVSAVLCGRNEVQCCALRLAKVEYMSGGKRCSGLGPVLIIRIAAKLGMQLMS